MSGCILPYLYITGNPNNGGSGHSLCLGVYYLIFILQVTLRTVNVLRVTCNIKIRLYTPRHWVCPLPPFLGLPVI